MKKIKLLFGRTLYKLGKISKPVIKMLVPSGIMQKIKVRVVDMGMSNQNNNYLDKNISFGVNLIGHIKAQIGLGQGARCLASSLESGDLPFCLIDIKAGLQVGYDQEVFKQFIVKETKYNINLIHINPDDTFKVMSLMLPKDTLIGKYNIGYWLYELENIPAKWQEPIKYVNEIWTPSEFITSAFKKVTDKPVFTIPYGVQVFSNQKLTRADFNLPDDKFLFLTMYDTNSSYQRKNPLGSINAFKKAFAHNKKAAIVIKINNVTERDLIIIKNELAGCDNYFIVDKLMEKNDVERLIELCDVFVSLHRSEGFGLVCAEAMLLNTPCVATNYSANIDFMNKTNSCLVDYKLVEIDFDHPIYFRGNVWAEPDINNAAAYMLKLFNDREYYNKIKDNAREHMKQDYSIEKCYERIANRIKNIEDKYFI